MKDQKKLKVLKKLKEGEKCPICKTTLEWSQTRECENCGFDKP